MKKLNFLFALMASLALIGCSHGAKKADTPATPASQSSVDDLPPDDGTPADVPALKGDTATGVSATLDPKYKSLAQALRSGKSKAITDQASKLLGTNAYDPVALNALALLHLKKGHTGAAKLLLTKALEKNQNASLYNNLGVALENEGDDAGALSNFKRAYKADMQNKETAGNLGSLYLKGGDMTRALPLLEQSYKANPRNLGIANNYAVALRGSGDLDGASKIYDAIIKADGKNVEALLNQAILLIDFMNKPKDGLTLVYKLKFLETDRKDVLARANALEKKAKAGLQ